MYVYNISVINHILNFRRFVTVTALDRLTALDIARKAFPGFHDIESCRCVAEISSVTIVK